MAKKDRGAKGKQKDREQESPPSDDTGTATIDAGLRDEDIAIRASGQSPPQLAPDARLDPGRPDATAVEARLDHLRDVDPRTAPAPAGADLDTSLAATLGSLGDVGKAVRTSPDHHGIGSTFPGETDLTKGSDRDSLLSQFDLKGGGSAKGSKPTGKPHGSGLETDASKGTGGALDSGSGKSGSGTMGDLGNLPPGVQLNDNAPNWQLYADENLKGLLPNLAGDDKKPFKAADAADFKAKQDKSAGNTDQAYKDWLKKTSPDGGTKYSDPDAAGGTIVAPASPEDVVKKGDWISHPVNPQDDIHGGADVEGFNPKADPHDPYVLRDPDATGGDVPTTVDGPPPDPGAGISHPVNPQDDLGGQFVPQTATGGTQGNPQTHVGEATLGEGSVEGAPHAPAVAQQAPQVAFNPGNDFAAPEPGAPVGGPDASVGPPDDDDN